MSSELPTASVVVPVYNGERTLGACLDSLLALQYPPERLEIIVVDNASTDETPGILERFMGRPWHGSGKPPQRVVLNESTRGPGAARNRGLAAVRGEVVAFTDADCFVDPQWLAHLVSPLTSDSVGVSAGRILAKRPCTEIQRFSEILDDHAAYVSQRVPSAITMNWASPTELIRDLGGFDETFLSGEDSDLAFRIFLTGRAFVYMEDAVIYHENPETLRELMHEGCRNGLSSVRLAKKHSAARKRYGVRRVYPSTYRQMVVDLFDLARGSNRTRAACSLFFGVGKKVGRVAGSIRFGYLAL